MRVVHSWLAELVPGLPDAATCGDALTRASLKLETVERAGEGLEDVVVGEVLDIEELTGFKKPIRFVQVGTGAGPISGSPISGSQPRGIVCGATNFAVGDRVPVALPGAELPGPDGKPGSAISARQTYGRTSDGMICSSRELGIGDDHRGILVLPPDTPIGVEFATVIGMPDNVLDLEITSDRGYALSHRGVARELGIAFDLPFLDPADVDLPSLSEGYPVRIDDPSGCSRYVARTVSGLDSAITSPPPLASRLALAGMRSISLAVDVTNAVLLGLGQPLHAFDLDKLSGAIVVRRARPGETIVTLDGEKRNLVAEDLVITDDSGPIAIAGVMGGASTEVTASTTRVLIESACFDPVSVARTARRLGLPSEASRRFERGVDPALAPFAAEVAVRMLVDFGGASAERVGTDVDLTAPPTTVGLPLAEAERLIGRGYPVEVQRHRLEQLGCAVEVTGTGLRVTPPTWRFDLERPADLVEEIARLEGYETIPVRLPRAPAGRGLTPAQRGRRRVADALADAGFAEVLLLPFLAGDVADRLGLPADDERRAAPRVANPLAEDERELRTTLLPGLLAAAARNVSRGNPDVALAEVGTVFRARPPADHAPEVPGVAQRPTAAQLAALDATLPDQPRHVAVLLTGRREPAGWWGPGRVADWSDAVETARLLARVVGTRLTVRSAQTAPWHPGRCAELVATGSDGSERVIGHAGELHPRVVSEWELPPRAVAMELDLDQMLARIDTAVEVPPVSPYPPADRDVALVVAAEMPAGQVIAALRDGAGPLLESTRLFDVYDRIGPGERSLAFRLRWRAADRTLTAEEVNELRDTAVRAAAERTGARLRS
ncbi:MAG TPA: phenylalanine--tRNA ligase subunit beta [Frankiaceae bacterium]|nr:phenylalanine--tRNA ligase subunit beta [Frankiaceae bacterium]